MVTVSCKANRNDREVKAMFTVLEGTGGDVLAIEISGGYTKADVAAFKQAFETLLTAGPQRINVLCKIDQLALGASEWSAFVEDARYALTNRNKLRHLAIVTDSKALGVLIKLDNLMLGDPEHGLIERYFAVTDLDQAWRFVRE